jgi:hypothetical protein
MSRRTWIIAAVTILASLLVAAASMNLSESSVPSSRDIFPKVLSK